MDSVDYGRKLAQTFHLSEDDCIKAMRQEASDIRAAALRKPTHVQALSMAYKHIEEWLQNGKTYEVKLDWESLAQFSLLCRRACVWAVLTAKGRK